MKTKEHGIPEYLNSEEEMIAHLNETLNDSDPASFLVALGDIAASRNINQISEITRIPVDELNVIFSGRSDPLFFDVLNITKALGLNLHF
ncbi:putative addiction module antidote protein [Salmonella enterica]|nr:putative addiction module antidote protein [Salmonella enterica subsp. diarizonae]EKO1955344.1 putative addiction module antidote protein [Salmonella enterica]MDJ6850173.1 putative addiction module antidote protein [Salmonella enterica]